MKEQNLKRFLFDCLAITTRIAHTSDSGKEHQREGPVPQTAAASFLTADLADYNNATTGLPYTLQCASTKPHIRNRSLYPRQPESQTTASTVLLQATLPKPIRVRMFSACSELLVRCRPWLDFSQKTDF